MKLFMFFILLVSHLALAEVLEEGTIGYSYPDKESREFLIKVLESLNKKYSVKEEGSKITIFWQPESNTEEKEVSGRVSQFNFIRNVCPNSETPLPSQESKKELSC